jgi:hypothetical protein
MTKYRIEEDGQAVPTFVVVYLPTNENLSHHESMAEARAAVRRYQAADTRREQLDWDTFIRQR